MEYTNVIITDNADEKIREVFGKYFTKPRISLGSLCRKSFSFMTTLSMMYPDSNCIFDIRSDRSTLKYECIISIDGKRLFVIMYNLTDLQDCDNVNMLIKSVFIKQKYLKLLYNDENKDVIIKITHKDYITYVHRTIPTKKFVFGYLCKTEKLSFKDKLVSKLYNFIFSSDEEVNVEVIKK